MNIVTFEGNKFFLPTKRLQVTRKIELKDGVNYLDDDKYTELKKQKVYKEGIEKGYLKVIEPKDKERVKGKRKSPKKIIINEIGLEDAKVLASSETDKKKLKEWLTQEKSTQNRKEVLAILEHNIKTGEVI